MYFRGLGWSFLTNSFRNEMKDEIVRIDQTLPNIEATSLFTTTIQQWITRVLGGMEHYKFEHHTLVKEAMMLLELALWKAKLLNEAGEKKCNINEVTKKATILKLQEKSIESRVVQV